MPPRFCEPGAWQTINQSDRMQIELTEEYLASQGFSSSLPKRFWEKVNKQGSIQAHCPELGNCWEWTGAKDEIGYGMMFTIKGVKSRRAHRISWAINVGPIPENLLVLHKCDNPPCKPEPFICWDSERQRSGRLQKGTSEGSGHIRRETLEL